MRIWVRHLQKVSHLKEKVPVGLGGVGKNLLILDLLRKLVPPPSLRVAMVELEEEETVGQVVLVNTINMMKTMTFL